MAPWVSGLVVDLPLIAVSAGLPFAVFGLVLVVRGHMRDLGDLLLPLLSVSLLGAVAGIAGGSSRTGVVGDVIPAALTLIGTISIYVFGAKPERGPVVALTAAAFALALGLGYATGAAKRGPLDAVAQNFAFCADVFSDGRVYASEDSVARAAELFGPMCANALGFSHDKTVPDEAGEDAASVIPLLGAAFQSVAARAQN